MCSHRNLALSSSFSRSMLASDLSAAWSRSWGAMRSLGPSATKLTHLALVLVTRPLPVAARSKPQSLSLRSNSRRTRVTGTQRRLLRLPSRFYRLSSQVTSRLKKSKSVLLQSISQDSGSCLSKRLTPSSMK